jgi:hypothetical protein
VEPKKTRIFAGSLATFPLKIQKAASARADSPQEMIFRLGTLERELWKL